MQWHGILSELPASLSSIISKNVQKHFKNVQKNLERDHDCRESETVCKKLKRNQIERGMGLGPGVGFITGTALEPGQNRGAHDNKKLRLRIPN